MKFPLECLTLRRIHYERNVAIIIFCAFAFADTISSSLPLFQGQQQQHKKDFMGNGENEMRFIYSALDIFQK
jgi:hypothetical protein